MSVFGVNINLDNPVSKTLSRRREERRQIAEIRRQYKANLESIDGSKIEIIPQQDKRISLLDNCLQDTVIEVNAQIKSHGEHIEGDVYRVHNEEAIEEITEELEYITSTLRLDTEPTVEILILTYCCLIGLMVLLAVTDGQNPFIMLFEIL
jgi:hypothetical protein